MVIIDSFDSRKEKCSQKALIPKFPASVSFLAGRLGQIPNTPIIIIVAFSRDQSELDTLSYYAELLR